MFLLDKQQHRSVDTQEVIEHDFLEIAKTALTVIVKKNSERMAIC